MRRRVSGSPFQYITLLICIPVLGIALISLYANLSDQSDTSVVKNALSATVTDSEPLEVENNSIPIPYSGSSPVKGGAQGKEGPSSSEWCNDVANSRNRNLSHWDKDGSEVIYNGIRLQKPWPPNDRTIDTLFDKKMPPPPYSGDPPRVIPIDVGRQLFVDEFLSESEADISRIRHSFKPDTTRITKDLGIEAQTVTDGAWYDGESDTVRLYHRCEATGLRSRTCVALSRDGGITWQFPDLSKRRPLASGHGSAKRKGGRSCAAHCGEGPDQQREFSAITLNDDATTPAGRWVLGYENHVPKLPETMPLWTSQSADGLGDWERLPSPSRASRTHAAHSYNPFRKVWVWILRHNSCVKTYTSRYKRYAEGPTLSHPFKFWVPLDPQPPTKDFMTCPSWHEGEPVFWMGADIATDEKQGSGWRKALPSGGETAKNIRTLIKQKIQRPPDLYAVSLTAYESVTIGVLALWDGEMSNTYDKKLRTALEFSRDGFHFPVTNPRQYAFPPVKNCRYDIMANGNFIISGDEIHIYWICILAPKLKVGRVIRARLRRDGFTGIIAAPSARPETGGVLVTRTLSACGAHLFVNVDLGVNGSLAIAVLPPRGHPSGDSPVPGAAEKDMDPLPKALSSVKHAIKWRGGNEQVPLNSLGGFRLKFTLKGTAELYSFWMARNSRGASLGFLGGGEVGKKRLVDV
eukprot:TRINITY_DN3054_c0_g2_i1.p1 TRINITY_DN3054_c0_g2~~TRINITY_DN3054_c0_g2_i1.p1  ORF type:complete len:711 (-),score=-14.16 TRINITY_DN3054_c0_g2_i1:187-2259(-)